MWLKPSLKLKGSVSRAFRLPSYTDLYYSDPANYWQSESGAGACVGLRRRPAVGPRQRLKGEVTIFERRDRDVIDYVPQLGFFRRYMAREHSAKLRIFTGVEAFGGIAAAAQSTRAVAYTGLHGVQQSLNGLQTKYSFNYPTHDGVIAWNGRLPGKFIARTRIGVVDRYAQRSIRFVGCGGGARIRACGGASGALEYYGYAI